MKKTKAKPIGRTIRLCRQYNGLSQTELGKMLGFPKNSAGIRIGQYEKERSIAKSPIKEKPAKLLGIHKFAISRLSVDSELETLHILMESVLEGMAEYYSRELSQKVTRGMNLNAQKCLYNGGTVPLGYKIVEKKFVVDEFAAQYVNKIFEMYSTGSTIKEIITYLNEKNIRTATNAKFNYSSLNAMLHNRKYIGFYKFGDIEVKDGVPRIISDKLFEKVQRELEKNKNAPARTKAIEEYLLTTKLFCGYCKEMMVGVSGTSSTKKKFCYYSCNKARKKLCNKMYQKNIWRIWQLINADSF